ncbi:hypothetical protein Trydic_g7042 [Trypoxylus dichotomus]
MHRYPGMPRSHAGTQRGLWDREERATAAETGRQDREIAYDYRAAFSRKENRPVQLEPPPPWSRFLLPKSVRNMFAVRFYPQVGITAEKECHERIEGLQWRLFWRKMAVVLSTTALVANLRKMKPHFTMENRYPYLKFRLAANYIYVREIVRNLYDL